MTFCEKTCELKRLFPVVSGAEVIVSDEVVRSLIDKRLDVLQDMENGYSEVRFEKIKRKMDSLLGYDMPYDFKIMKRYSDSGIWDNTYYAILGEHGRISSLIDKSRYMANEGEDVDPLGACEHKYQTHVYVECSVVFPPLGIEGLMVKKKENRYIRVFLVVSNGLADRLIRGKNEQV